MSTRPGIRYFPLPSMTNTPLGMAIDAVDPMSRMRPSTTITVMSSRTSLRIIGITLTPTKATS